MPAAGSVGTARVPCPSALSTRSLASMRCAPQKRYLGTGGRFASAVTGCYPASHEHRCDRPVYWQMCPRRPLRPQPLRAQVLPGSGAAQGRPVGAALGSSEPVGRRAEPRRWQEGATPPLHSAFRILSVVLSKLLDRWEDLAHLMKPETAKRWHASAFRLFWRWHSRTGCACYVGLGH